MNDMEILQARIKELESKIETNNKQVVLKVSQKGCVQINGIRRMPITLYRQEMETILNMSDEIKKFIADNSDDLSVKA